MSNAHLRHLLAKTKRSIHARRIAIHHAKKGDGKFIILSSIL